jgi:hypothetical protein
MHEEDRNRADDGGLMETVAFIMMHSDSEARLKGDKLVRP